MSKTQKILCIILCALMILPLVVALILQVNAATTFTKMSAYSFSGGNATYTKYSLTGNNGVTVDANVLECNNDDYLMMVYSGAAASALNLKDHYDRALADGYDVIGMINGSFFSMDNKYGCYGRLVEYDVSNGELFSGDDGNPADSYDGAVCILSDGTVTSVPNTQLAFHLSVNGTEYPGVLGTVNKTGGSKASGGVDNWSDRFYYFDHHVGQTVPTYATLDGATEPLSGYEIIVEKTVNTGLRIGGTLTGKVKEIKKGGAGSATDPNEFVLFVRASSPNAAIAEAMRVGDVISVSVEETIASSKAITEKANSITENVNYLVKDGVNLTLDATKFNKTAAHPASQLAMWAALGVKADGTYVLATTSGAVTGNSGSVKQEDLAALLLGLGCTTVIRMDGGGSSAMYLKDAGSGSAGYQQNQGRKVADCIMIVRRSTSPALQEGKTQLQAAVQAAASRTEKPIVAAAFDAQSVLQTASSVSGDYRREQMKLEAVVNAYDQLSDLILEAEGADRTLYTETMWNQLQQALANAHVAMQGGTAQAVVSASSALQQALQQTGDKSINVALHKPYQADPAPSSSWPDADGVELTDGILGIPENAASSSWSGYSGSGSVDITVDLGEKVSGLYQFSAQFLNMSSWGICVPTSVTVSVSSDGSSFQTVGTFTSAQILGYSASSDGVAYTYTVSVDRSVSARYIRYTVVRSSSWFFIGEVQAFKQELAGEGFVTRVLRGDINGDGTVDPLDYFRFKRAWLQNGAEELTDEQIPVWDVNGDGEVSALDYFALKRAILAGRELGYV